MVVTLFINYWQLLLISSPLIIMLLVNMLPIGATQWLKMISLGLNLILFNCLGLVWWYLYQTQIIFYSKFNIIFQIHSNFYTYFIKFDILNISFLILTTFLITICLLITWQWLPFFYSLRQFINLLLLLEFFSFQFFIVDNLFYFYIFFESVLIPMYFLIGIWGLRQRKIHASYQFFLYTFAGSLLMLLSIISLGFTFKSFHITFLEQNLYLFQSISLSYQLLIWLGFFIAFAIKTPMVPVHIWLPEAHVEAPTTGSVILAGLLLKFGTFGFYRILIAIFNHVTLQLFWILVSLSLLSIIYGSIITYSQIDFKKIIAYSSISHMGYVIYGLVLDNLEGLQGALFMMFTHGFISSALFFSVGILYERYGTRNIFDYGGLKTIMPLFSLYFFLLTLANMNLPLTAGFVAEFLVLLGSSQIESLIIIFLGVLGVFTNGVYCIWLFNRLCMGHNILNQNFKFTFSDIDRREHFIFFIFIFFIVVLGIFPHIILTSFEPFSLYILWSKLY